MAEMISQPDLEQGQHATAERPNDSAATAPTNDMLNEPVTLIQSRDQAEKNQCPPLPNTYENLIVRLQPERNDKSYGAKYTGQLDEINLIQKIPALEMMYRLNVQRAKLALYTDYYMIKVDKITSHGRAPSHSELSVNISRYCKS